MKNYMKLLILFVVLVVLLAAVMVVQKNQGRQVRETRIAQTSPMFPDLNMDSVMRIEISSLQNESLLLRKNAGVWEVSTGKDVMGGIVRQSQDTSGAEGEAVEPANPADDLGPAGDGYRRFYKADMEKVQPMLDSLKDLPMGQVVTSNRDKFAQFGVLGALTGIEVRLYDSEMNILANLTIGNQGAAMTNTYVRKDDTDDIREVAGRLAMTFGMNLIGMRDRVIFASAPETITSVYIQDIANASGFSLTRAEGAWTGTDAAGTPLELDPASVDSLVSQLGSMSANSFVDMSTPPRPMTPEEIIDPNDPYGVMNPTIRIEFTTVDGARHGVNIGRLEGTTYYAASESDIFDVFKVSKTTIDSIAPDPASLAPGAEVPAQELDAADSGEMNPGDEVRFEDLPPDIQRQIREQTGQ